jgi:hypothetical protein
MMVPQSRIAQLGTLDSKWKWAEHAWQGELDRLFGTLAYKVRLVKKNRGLSLVRVMSRSSRLATLILRP